MAVNMLIVKPCCVFLVFEILIICICSQSWRWLRGRCKPRPKIQPHKKQFWMSIYSVLLVASSECLLLVKAVKRGLTLNIPSLARQRCLPSWGPWRTPAW